MQRMDDSSEFNWYPTAQDIHRLFLHLRDYPTGHDQFFLEAPEDSTWHITGQHPFSGSWTKAAFLAEIWGSNSTLIAAPGPCFNMPRGLDSIVCDGRGRAAVELRSVHTTTKDLGLTYDQEYSWHCEFDASGTLRAVRIYLDSIHAEKVLVAEREAQKARRDSMVSSGVKI
ncbi:uncharacterized protein BO66DRAFT_440799 [Aspergillus aculeatinus CBS 121060]|uniref:Uncharacterized protein n=1 Tax=Aspergillus aculeatinus CBS 121060 TaxID=1448322 RepID=A0ACD1H365_9EURO|nr:hypothetical protein BO66DRAFT_440799 [Aspergillus aculeatinus CBS 121060]RAH67865.1 hypothetical protein BO66DRAFT_440799 [Aspergillus aculeatinus CBS 121060]